MIPARLGSERLPRKNLALLNGEPLIVHAIRAAKHAGVFDRVVVNSEGSIFADIAAQQEVEFYHRPASLATSHTRSDTVVHDFAQQYATDIIVWVNPIAPLQPPAEIRAIVETFAVGSYDSCMTVRDESAHCNFRGKPLNYSPTEPFARTQDVEPVQRFVYSLMMWRRTAFLTHYAEHGYAIVFGRTLYYPVGHVSSFMVKTAGDLELCNAIFHGLRHPHRGMVEYYSAPEGAA